MKEAEYNTTNVLVRYAARLASVSQQIAADAAANPKSPPDMALVTERWQLQGKIKIAEMLKSLFAELDM
jgi:hypothetical protein